MTATLHSVASSAQLTVHRAGYLTDHVTDHVTEHLAGSLAGVRVAVLATPGGPLVNTGLMAAAGGVAGLGLWLLIAAVAGWDVAPRRLRATGWAGPHDRPGRDVIDGSVDSGVDGGEVAVRDAGWAAASRGSWTRAMPQNRRLRLTALIGLAVGVIAAGVLQLPVLALLAAGVVAVALEAAGGPSVPDLNARGAAVAAWCETVRQELDAGQPQRAALIAACDLPPAGLQEPLARLSQRLQTGTVPEALWAFAREVQHPAVGNVVAALDVAYRLGAADLPRLMAGQVETTRHQVQMLREVHAARAKHRRALVLLLGLFIGSIALLFAAWPDFLAAYRGLIGQLILLGIGVGVLLAVRAFLRLSQPPMPPTFFSHHTGASPETGSGTTAIPVPAAAARPGPGRPAGARRTFAPALDAAPMWPHHVAGNQADDQADSEADDEPRTRGGSR